MMLALNVKTQFIGSHLIIVIKKNKEKGCFDEVKTCVTINYIYMKQIFAQHQDTFSSF